MSGQESDDVMRNDAMRNTASGVQICDHREGEGPDESMTAEDADAEMSRLAGNPKGSGQHGIDPDEPYGVRKRREMESGTN